MTQPETETSTQTENREAEANLLRLAELKLKCPCVNKIGLNWNCSNCTPDEHNKYGKCDYCQGTCQVAKHETLRRECPGHDLRDAPTFHGTRYAFAGGNECSCQGRGWLPVSREKAGTEMRKMPSFVSLVQGGDDYGHPGYWVKYASGEDYPYKLHSAFATDPDHACIAALWKMEEAR